MKCDVKSHVSLYLFQLIIFKIQDVNIITKPKCENDKCQDFNNYLVYADIDSLVSKLVSINIDQVDNAVINSLVGECNTIILGAASNCNLL